MLFVVWSALITVWIFSGVDIFLKKKVFIKERLVLSVFAFILALFGFIDSIQSPNLNINKIDERIELIEKKLNIKPEVKTNDG